ncbi:trafficking protein particle complex subunit 8-like isoform X3 [Pomacea canaliculata]|uniref:trafficking protein particle complex subunit 8-like isoform X3 n=1 Tax=Pomacea canaliculata TaxID=400727 RepID=UPI000D72A6B9|nr:trafficking protein particle complex subunit 8-like isoform X3 [Pomacea canaliculata]
MSQCKQTAEEFIQSTFSPNVAVLCSADAELLCQKNNLTFQQLIQPFCRLSSEVHIRDANNVSHSIHGLRIKACDMSNQILQQAAIRKTLNDAVANAQLQQPSTLDGGRTNVHTFGNYDLHLNASAPWFESWRDCFLQTLAPSDHEYLNHCLACLFVVSSAQADPLSMFTALANQQMTQQQQFPNKAPRWFCQGVLHYYVLLHDVVDGEQARAEAVYQSMKSTFGGQICHLLQINSRSTHTLETMKTGPSPPDPWSQFLPKPAEPQEGVDYDGIGAEDDASFPTELSEGTSEINPTMLTSVESASELFEENLQSPTEPPEPPAPAPQQDEMFDHPLSLSQFVKPALQTELPSQENDLTAAANGYTDSGSQTTSMQLSALADRTKLRIHGCCLTTSDQDRLRIFMHEFVVRALIPWAERQMKILNDQLTSRKGIHRSIFSATKKWFGGNKPAGPIPASQNTTVVYTKDAPELQLRRLGDLAFLFQMYEFAYNTYHAAKKDFNNDHAWLHFAGSLEMASISIFMQGPPCQRPYPHHYMETAISTYLTSCRNPLYATRATLVSTEILKRRNMFSEAAMQFLKMITEEADLSSALFLEQAAHCFICMHPPMVRKYAFHMILAGHRFNKAGQRKHALRSYSQALQVYKSKHWAIAEDHIHFTIGRQSFNLKQLENATSAFKHLLTRESKQPSAQQGAFLREYLFVYKQLLSQEAGENSSYGRLPELPLPFINSNATKVLLGQHPTVLDAGSSRKKIPASGVSFNDDSPVSRWAKLEETAVVAGGSTPPLRPTLQCFTNATDNRFNPVTFVGEPVSIQVCVENPLQVMLVLSDITLLWTFLPTITGSDSSQLISNEVTSSVKNHLADEIIQTAVIKEVVLNGNQVQPIVLSLVPRQGGELRVVGIAYNLGTSSVAQNSTPAPVGNDISLPSSTGSSAAKPSYISTICVRGKQRLEVQGPRLNVSKEEKTGKVYGPDRRLDLVVQEEMPILNVMFCEFPDALLCGEVHCVEVEFSNIGKVPLRNLRVVSSLASFFTFGCGKESELPKYPYTYQMRNGEVQQNRVDHINHCKEYMHFTEVARIPLPGDGMLGPGQTVLLPVWLRGNDIGGVHEVDFVFYYEPVSTGSHVRYRVLRHRAVINTVESLSVRALATKQTGSVLRSAGQELNSCYIFCELENLSQVQVQRPHIQELQISQVSCASNAWTVSSLSTNTSKGIRIGSRETLQLMLKGTCTSVSKDGDQLLYSEVPFDMEQIDSTKTPCRDFYVRNRAADKSRDGNEQVVKRSGMNDHLDLEAALRVDLTLIFLWKAFVVQENGQMKILVGQHHVHIRTLDIYVTSYPLVVSESKQAPAQRPPLKFVSDTEQEPPSGPSAEVTTRLVSYSFRHAPSTAYSFKKGMCVVPVTLNLQNQTWRQVQVLIDTSKSSDRFGAGSNQGDSTLASGQAVTPLALGSMVFPSPVPLSSSMRWVGHTNAKVSLREGESAQLHLNAGFLRPGTYNLNTLAVFVTYSDDQSQMILQRQPTPSIITLLPLS